MYLDRWLFSDSINRGQSHIASRSKVVAMGIYTREPLQSPCQPRHIAEEVVMVEPDRDGVCLIFSSPALVVGGGGAPVRFFG